MNKYYVTIQNDELYHYGVKGMKWGIRRKTPEEKAERRRVKAVKKRDKIDRQRSYIRNENDTLKNDIREGVQTRNTLKAKKLPMQSDKAKIDNKLSNRNRYLTQFGYENDQDRSARLGRKIEDIERQELKNESNIAQAIHRMDINKQKLSTLDKRYEYLGRRYLGM